MSDRPRVVIAGQVLDAVTRQAIPGATVTISLDSTKLVTSTAADGWFWFLNLPEGQYNLEASLPNAGTRYGKITQPLKVDLDKTSGAFLQNNKPIKPFYSVILQLPPTSLVGIVTDSQGKGIGMAKVQIKGSGAYTFTYSCDDKDSGRDQKTGKYVLSGLEASKTPLRITVSAQGHPSKAKGKEEELIQTQTDDGGKPLSLQQLTLAAGERKRVYFQFKLKSLNSS